MKKILFISHDANRTGAPLLLLRLIEKIKLHAAADISILLKNGGELEGAFEKLGNTYLWNKSFTEGLLNNLKYRLAAKMNIRVATKQQRHRAAIIKVVNDADIIFNNTVTNAPLLKELPLNGKRVFSYFHELQVVTETLTTKDEIAFLDAISEKIFVPSMAVRDFFSSKYGIAGNKFQQLKYIIPPAANEIKKSSTAGVFSAGFCGTLHWRKGYEFLPLIAKKIISERNVKDIHFTWIGAEEKSIEYAILKNDLEKMGLADYFSFIAPAENIAVILANLDVLLLPSREDAFPLVVLEAASYGVPSIYFKGAGGIGEFVEEDAGVPVNYLDIDAMCDEIINLKNNESLRQSLGLKAKQKIMAYADDEKTVSALLEYFNHPSK